MGFRTTCFSNSKTYPFPIQTEQRTMAVQPETRIQAFVLFAIAVVGVALPVAIAELSTPIAFAVLAVVLPVLAILYSNTALPTPPQSNENAKVSVAQWLRWSQYVVIFISLIWTNALLSLTN